MKTYSRTPTLDGAADMLTILCVLLAYLWTRTILVMGSTEGKSVQKSDRQIKYRATSCCYRCCHWRRRGKIVFFFCKVTHVPPSCPAGPGSKTEGAAADRGNSSQPLLHRTPTTATAIGEADSSEHDHQNYGDGDASYFHFVGGDPGTSGDDTTGDDQAAGGGGGGEDDAGDDEHEGRLPEFVFYGVGGGGGGGKVDRESNFGRHLRLRILRVPPPVIKTKRCCEQ